MLFRSEELIDPWCAARGRARGEVLPMQTVWELSQRWYHNRLSADYRGRTAAEVGVIFREMGLTSAFWEMGGDPQAPQK